MPVFAIRVCAGSTSRAIPAACVRRILTRMSNATDIKDMDGPGYALHPLKWDRKGQWSVTVQANWRIVFCFDGKEFYDVDYIDYH